MPTKIEYEINFVSVTITLINGKTLNGAVNISNYNRFSDFIDKHESKYIRLVNVKNHSDIAGFTQNFLLISKSKVIYYCPEEKYE